MTHSATRVMLGTTVSSDKAGSEDFASSPSTYLAGLAVRRLSTGLLTLAKASGSWVGISLGRSLSDTSKTTVLKSGTGVPVRVARQPARGVITITSYAALVSGTDDTITIGATAFVAQSGAANPTEATFQAAVGNNETAASLCTQINAHVATAALVKATVSGAVVTITAKLNTVAGDTMVLTYTEADGNAGATVSGTGTLTDSDDTPDFCTIGSKVYFGDETGLADDPNSLATISDAVYVSGLMTGIDEDGVDCLCALVDMPGGL